MRRRSGGLPPSGCQSWWEKVRGRTISDGAGVTGKIMIDGIGFSLGGWTPLPTVPINPGAAMAAWAQTDPNSFSGYGDDVY